MGREPETVLRGEVSWSAESDGCQDEAVGAVEPSRAGPNETLPPPRRTTGNRWSPVCPGCFSACGSVEEGNWQPIIYSAMLSGYDWPLWLVSCRAWKREPFNLESTGSAQISWTQKTCGPTQ